MLSGSSWCAYLAVESVYMQMHSPSACASVFAAPGHSHDGLASGVQETEVAPIIADHWERASFPFEIIPKLRKLNLGASLGICFPWQSVC
jgi:hypothetical protein